MGSVIVGVDRSETAARAATAAAELAQAIGAPLHVVTAIGKKTSTEVRSGTDTFRIDTLDQAESFVSEVARRLGGPSATWSVQTSDPAHAVCSEAKRIGASYIVVGNRRTQGAGRVLGSIASAVLHHAPCHVVVAKTTKLVDLTETDRRKTSAPG